MLTGQVIVSEPLVTGGHKAEGITLHHQETAELIDNQGICSVIVSQVTGNTEVASSKEVYDQDVMSSDKDVVSGDQDMVSGDQDVTETVDDQNSAEPVSDQEIIDSITSQNVKVVADQSDQEATSIASQVVNEVVSGQDGDVVDQQATDQDMDKIVDNQEDVNKAVDQEVVNSQGVVEAVTDQVKEMVNDQEVTELVNTQEDSQDPNLLVNIDQNSVTNQSDVVGISQINQPPSLPLDIPQDLVSHDVVDTPHHSKSSLEQDDDIWQSSFIITQPSCINCPSELRSLWREPTIQNKVSTQPLQHYTLSLNSDQVICCDVIYITSS